MAHGTRQGQHDGPSAPKPKSGEPEQPAEPLARARGWSQDHTTELEQDIPKSETRHCVISKEYLIHQAATVSDLPLAAVGSLTSCDPLSEDANN